MLVLNEKKMVYVIYLLYIFNYHVVREDLCQTEN
jgi:hypothetical protein